MTVIGWWQCYRVVPIREHLRHASVKKKKAFFVLENRVLVENWRRARLRSTTSTHCDLRGVSLSPALQLDPVTLFYLCF